MKSLLQEYQKQQTWRNWDKYLNAIQMRESDSVIDLGCSVGDVSNLLSLRVKDVIGIDINQDFIDFCNSKKRANEEFICADFMNLDTLSLKSIDGIWASYSLSYLNDPLEFLNSLSSFINQGGWIALLDISCFISGNLEPTSQYYEKVKNFELESCKYGVYDFDFGAKMQDLLQNSGFKVVHVNNDVTDLELNFSGPAAPEIIESWIARLNRMNKLKQLLGEEFNEFCSELLSNLTSENHQKRENVKFVVAKKI